MSPTRFKLLETASRYISVVDIDEASFRAVRTPNCITHNITPTKRSSQTNDEILAFYPKLRKVLSSYKLAVVNEHLTIVEEATRKVVLNLRMTSESTVGPVENENVTILVMNESGDLVEEIFVFLDSALYTDFANRLETALASLD
jgi:hypothetical protein